MGLALLFPGQGAQHAQMLPWLDDTPALAALAAHLGHDWRARLAEPGWMHANAVAQPLLTGLGLAAWQTLATALPRPVAVAGYSVGELAAFAAVGVFDADTALALAAARARAMDDCAAGIAGGLMAVQGPDALAWASASAGLHIAIRISPERVIVGGRVEALDAAGLRGGAAGLRCSRLPIGVASHTPLMAAATAAFAKRLAGVELRPAQAAVVCNVSGAASRQPAVLGPALASQIAATVRWDDAMDALAERGTRCVLEVGPGTTLAAMWQQRHPGIPVRSVEEFRAPEAIAAWVRAQLA